MSREYKSHSSNASNKSTSRSNSNYWHRVKPPDLWQPESQLGNYALCNISDVIEIRNGLVRITDSTAKRKTFPCPDREPGDIKQFSYNSRMRLMRLTASILLDKYSHVVHCTVTYHNDFPTSSPEIKRLFHNFYVQLQRKLRFTSLIWRLEFQKRGAPHYHIVFLFKDKRYSGHLELLRQKISRIWLAVIGTDTKASQIHAVKLTTCEDYKKFFTYVSKYSAKVESEIECSYSGRRWGFSDNLEVGILDLHLPRSITMKIFKSKLKKFLREQNRLSHNLELIWDDAQTLEIFLDSEISRRLYDEAVEESPPI